MTWLGLARQPLRIVTGADSSHARSLVQLLESIKRREPRVAVTIYDLGLTAAEQSNARAALPSAQMKAFDYSAWPAHLNIRINAGQYAWKSVIVWDELQTNDLPLVWMDAGNRLRRDLRNFRRELQRDKFLACASDGSIHTWTHPAMLDRLGLGSGFDQSRQNLNAACVAFDPTHEPARQLAKDWARYALDRDCIAPDGSDRSNHRQDQALLTVLAYRSGLITAPTERIQHRKGMRHEVLLHQDVEPRTG